MIMQQSVAFLVLVPAVGGAEVVSRSFDLRLDRIVTWDIGSALRVQYHFFATGGLLRRGSWRLQQGLFDYLEDSVNQKTGNAPEEKSNQHSNYQVVRKGTSSSTPMLAAASSVTV